MSKVCFDTQILIWGVQRQVAVEWAERVGRARRYIRHLAETGAQIMLPTPVIVEYLVGLTVEAHAAELEIFEKNFELPPFDIPSARVAASLLCDTPRVRAIREAHGVGRQAIRTDVMILAIAIAHGASKVISEDAAHFEKLARGRVSVEPLPDIQIQQELFGD